MTPKEKAEELYKMYNNILIEEIIDRRPTYLVMTHKMAKECALIAVNEVLKAAFYAKDEVYDFYIEVKQEIEKL